MSRTTTTVISGRDAVSALGGRVIDPTSPTGDGGAGTPVLRLGNGAVSEALLDQLHTHVMAGGRLIIAVSADAPDHHLAALRRFGRCTVGAELVGISQDNPLLADTRVRATTPIGTHLHLDRVRPVHTPGQPLAWAEHGEPIAGSLDLGSGTVVVLGTDCLLHDRWLTWPDNASFLAHAITGRSMPDAAEHLESLRATPPGTSLHASAPVVVAEPWLDPATVAGTSPNTLLTTAGHLGRRLPADVHDALIDFVDDPHPSGALLLRSMPIGIVPPTPLSPTAIIDKDLTSELSLLTVARRLGQPVGYLPEHGGTLIQNILPTPVAADHQVSTSSKVELMFHTEAAFHPHRPRFLVLLCLRGDPDGVARTTLASIREVLPLLPLHTRRVLFEPRFRTAADESYVGGRPTQLGAPVPVLSGHWESPSMVFDADLMVGIDEEADRAVHDLAGVISSHHTGVVLQAGDLLVVDNTLAVHGRSPFRARFDGTDRWLQRAFVVADLAASAADRDGRIITTRFAR